MMKMLVQTNAIRAMATKTMRLLTGLGAELFSDMTSPPTPKPNQIAVFLQANTLALPYGDWLGFLSEGIHAGKK